MTDTTFKPTANSTLAAKLTKLGFHRGVSSWEKSTFTMNVWDDNPNNLGSIRLEVNIRNSPFAPDGTYVRNNWIVSGVRMTTQRGTAGDWRKQDGRIDVTPLMLTRLNDTLSAIQML